MSDAGVAPKSFLLTPELAAYLVGHGTPPDTHQLHALTGKADLSKALVESFEYCDSALKGMDDRKAMARSATSTAASCRPIAESTVSSAT